MSSFDNRDRRTEQVVRNDLGGGEVERSASRKGIGERPARERRIAGHDARDVPCQAAQVSLRGMSCICVLTRRWSTRIGNGKSSHPI